MSKKLNHSKFEKQLIVLKKILRILRKRDNKWNGITKDQLICLYEYYQDIEGYIVNSEFSNTLVSLTLNSLNKYNACPAKSNLIKAKQEYEKIKFGNLRHIFSYIHVYSIEPLSEHELKMISQMNTDCIMNEMILEINMKLKKDNS